MHLVAALGRAEMGEAGAGDVDMRGIGVVDRRQDPLLLHRGGEIDRLADAAIGDELAQRRAGLDRLAGEFERGARALHEPAFAARGDDQRALAFFVDDLGQSHVPSLGAATRASSAHE